MAKYLDSDGVLYLWNKVKGLFGKGVTGLTVNGKTITFTKGDGTTGVIVTQDTNTTYGLATTTADGLMAKTDKSKLDAIAVNANNYTHPTTSGNKHVPTGGKVNQVLEWSSDGTAKWVDKVTFSAANMVGSTATVDGQAGYVPAPIKGTQNKFLKGDGTWSDIPKYSLSTPTADGLMSAGDKKSFNDLVSIGSIRLIAIDGNNGVYNITGKNDELTIQLDRYFDVSVNSGQLTINLNTGGAIANSSNPSYEIPNSQQIITYVSNKLVNYAQKSDIVGMYKYKGSVATSANLPTTAQTKGDVYNIQSASKYGAAGANVAWDGTQWDSLGEIFAIDSITNAELDVICA